MRGGMQIAAGTVVTLNYDLCKEDGEIIESSDLSGPITFVHGSSGLIKGLDAKLTGLSEGDERDFAFTPEEAFGRSADAPRRELPRTEFPAGADLQKGQRFEAGVPGNPAAKIVLEIVDTRADAVTVRMIHPLADQSLRMSIRVLAVREATKAEQESGRAISRPPPPPKR
jgi:FKBP-type peptidyl-prolyl cis-trans isomerase SlyD